MPDNAFVAALLMQAAEERHQAERARFATLPGEGELRGAVLRRWVRQMNDRLEAEAREYEGRAEIYERYAIKSISDTVADGLSRKFGPLTGPVELLPMPPGDLESPYRRWQYAAYYFGSPVGYFSVSGVN